MPLAGLSPCLGPWTPTYPAYPGPAELTEAPGLARPRASSGHWPDSVFVQTEPPLLACRLSLVFIVMIVTDSGSRQF